MATDFSYYTAQPALAGLSKYCPKPANQSFSA